MRDFHPFWTELCIDSTRERLTLCYCVTLAFRLFLFSSLRALQKIFRHRGQDIAHRSSRSIESLSSVANGVRLRAKSSHARSMLSG
jgi:hypothetical protein